MKYIFKSIAIIFTAILLSGLYSCTDPIEPDPGQEEPGDTDSTEVSGIVELGYSLQSTYQTLHFENLGEYQLLLSNTEKIDEQGMPAEEGGLVFLLYLNNAIDEDPMNATLPSGVYTSSEEKEEWALVTEHSAAFLCINGEIAMSPMDGTVTVKNEKGDYIIDIDTDLPMLSTDTMVHLTARFTGDLGLIDITSPLAPEIKEDVNLEFDGVYGRYYGNFYYPHSDDINLTFTLGDVTVDEYGIARLTDGYSLCLYSVYMPKLDNYNTQDITIAEGTYSVDTDRTWLMYSESSMPFLIEKGQYEKNPFGEDYFPVGSYLEYIDKETGETKLGLLNSGTMTVVRNGDNYEFTFDFIAENGVKIKGTYTGKFTSMINANDNDLQPIMQARPWTTLTGDIQIDFVEGTEFCIYLSGNYLDPAYDQVIFTLAHPEDPGAVIMSQIVTERGAANTEIPTGTYTVSWDIKPFTIFPGWYSMNQDPLYTWYGDTREESINLVAIDAGTIEITKNGSDYTLNINFTDQKGYKITGTWTGPAIYPSAAQAQSIPMSIARPLF